MNLNKHRPADFSVRPDGDFVDVTQKGKAIIALDPKSTLIDYSGLNFKEMLLACPIDDIDLERSSESSRAVEF